MENDFTFASQAPLYSITNVDTAASQVLDAQAPFDFYTFLKFSQQELSPMQFNDAYQKYLYTWGATKKQNEEQTTQLVRNNYIELLKDITLNYLTFEERRFITAADYTNALDLDILIPFYSRKLREICNFYADKREKLKYKIKAVQEKGTRNSLEQAIFETLTDYVFIADDENLIYNVPAIKIENIIAKLQVEVEELYDLYSSYLDNSPNKSYEDYDVQTQLRKDLYSSNINEIEYNIFLNFDDAIKQYIFKTISVYLKSLGEGFTVNVNPNVISLSCAENQNPLCPCSELIDANKVEASRVLLLRKKLIEKYIGADFYYIKTGDTITSVTSGELFKAANPSGNLLNRHHPTTASVEETSQLYTARRMGLFFRPEKNGLLYFSAPENKYKIDETKLEPNKVYIYPDPSLYGNTTGLTNETDGAYPLIHIQDYSSNVSNASFYHAEGDVRVSPYQQSFYAYYSRNQLSNNIQTNLAGLSTNLAYVVDRGPLMQWSSDIFGNQYGLFKSNNRKYLVDTTTTTNESITSYEYYDGGVIKFDNGNVLPEQVFADVGAWVQPNIFASDYYYNTLFDGGIGNVINGFMIRAQRNRRLYDGLYFYLSVNDFDAELNEFSVDGITTDYDTGIIVECGYFSDPIIYEGDFTFSYILSSIQYKEVDGGPIIRTETGDIARDTGKNLMLNETLTAQRTQLLSADNTIASKSGEVFIRDVVTGVTNHLSSAYADVMLKYSSTIQTELLSSVINFNAYVDLVYFRTTNYFVVDKVGYGSGIESRSATNNSLCVPASAIAEITQPFFFENKDYALMCVVSAVSAELNSCLIQPTFYRINYETAIIQTLELSSMIVDEFKNPVPVKISNIVNPLMVYNSRNDLHTLIATVYDVNNFAYIFQMFFDLQGDVVVSKGTRLLNFINGGYARTINWIENTSLQDFVFNNITTTSRTVTGGALVIYG